MQEQQVIVYTQPGCGPCAAEKEFLAKHGIDFEERDIRENPEYVRELLELGAQATPTTLVGETVVMGFDRAKLSELLDL